MTIALIDTSIFCELLPVPGMAEDHVGHLELLEKKVDAKESLLLPMATLFETGNHIGQNGDGRVRRSTALRFVKDVRDALDEKSPFAPLQFPSETDVERWIDAFPDWATQGSGLGDLSIVKDWERQCALAPRVRVYIWSKDKHLAGYDRRP